MWNRIVESVSTAASAKMHKNFIVTSSANKDITQIVVNRNKIGIVGLMDDVESMVPQFSGRSDDEIQAELLRRLSEANYVPRKLTEDYGRALLREYKKNCRECPVEESEESSRGLEIRVLGPGCAHCDMMMNEVMSVLSETGLAANVEHVTNIREIVRIRGYGIIYLVISGRVVSVGQFTNVERSKSGLRKSTQTEKNDMKAHLLHHNRVCRAVLWS